MDDLQAYSIGLPSDELIARVDEHLADCSECAQAVSGLIRTSFREDMARLMDPPPRLDTREARKRRKQDNELIRRFHNCWRSIPVDDEFWADLVRSRVLTRGMDFGHPDSGSGYTRRTIGFNRRSFKWF